MSCFSLEVGSLDPRGIEECYEIGHLRKNDAMIVTFKCGKLGVE